MLKITRETDYALLIMTHLAKHDDAKSASQISSECHLSPAFTSKILKILTKESLLASIRGSQGGYLLNKKPEDISLLEILVAIEGPMSINDCVGDHSACERSQHCELTSHWALINQILLREFSNISLASLAALPHRERQREVVIPITKVTV
ncbi:SUF system Fe-S cluster assembly regulator [Wohlfahrtiimonas chitiniclastica]|uniref:SUF system Fe-S cluster assembly regulator n=2 Tax=Wohlfahrtiimonas chitiniclastica TaxID=400946 RepID=A0A162V1D0_9GAMM|nr:SUF system Fe-S cluster assembly regulator [Wohlfahrtiimonas chitiniclastica]ELV07746.1 Putative HTH-type transcriptional regulator YffB [Wohlfahrtiimonas chitiniclastica SH04]KZS23365.1 SUF system Fe-S cluster assembly regulator [Wohlfahrtiimonas chitiniclastica]KZX37021.1 transcriptional regulator [Wohlfahrtiimonas chitiniclastica]MBS7815428.1 SUF system Fe-S cluster assembly regulator [Wohlfahrtiimonas chitiniclastica]MBS7817626.1 SUF system Fe-S cluster assembly regulator [Wohlfahrtiimo